MGSAIRELGFEVFRYGLFTKGHRQADARDDQSAGHQVAAQPGDIVSADDDGVMVVPKATSARVVKIAARIETPLSRA